MKFAKGVCRLIAVCFMSVLLLLQSVSAAEDTKKPQPQIVGKILQVDYVFQKDHAAELLVWGLLAWFPRRATPRFNWLGSFMRPRQRTASRTISASRSPPSGPAAQVISEVKATNRWEAYESYVQLITLHKVMVQ